MFIVLILLSVAVFALIRKQELPRYEAATEALDPADAMSPAVPVGIPSSPAVPSATASILRPARSLITSETYPLDADVSRTTMIMKRAPEVAAFLLVLNGPQRGQQLKLSGNEANIGRDPQRCDICIDNPSLSREHARIRLEGGDFVIYDLVSTNGTYVNGQHVLRERLRDRDEIRVGDTNLIFVNIAADVSQDAKQRLREFEATWNDLLQAARYEQ